LGGSDALQAGKGSNPVALEGALREQGRLLQTAITGAPIVLFALDRNGTFTLAEGRGLEKLGQKPGELVGQSVFEVYPDLPNIREKFRPALAGEMTSSIDRLGGRVFESHFSPLLDDDGTLSGVIGVATDITERTIAEDALKASELKYRTLVEQMSEGLILVDNKDRVLFVNDRFCEMVGYDRGELVGGAAMDLLLNEEDKALERSRMKLRQQGITEQYEIQLKRRSGELIWAQLGGAPVVDSTGVVVGAISVLTDITGRKKAEELLQESERRFRQLADFVQGVVWMMDQSKPEILFVSREYENIWGRTRKSLFENPRSFLEGIHPADRPRVEAAMREQLEGDDTDLEYRVLRPDQSVRWVRGRSFPLKDQYGRVYRTIGVVEDITYRKQLDESHAVAEAMLRLVSFGLPVVLWTTDRELRLRSIESEFLNRDYRIHVRPLHDGQGEIVGCAGMAIDVTEQGDALEEIRTLVTDLEQRVLERTAQVVTQKDELERANEQLGRAVADLNEARKRAEEASNAKSNFLTHINHELRTPLNSVIGFANVLLKNREKGLDEQDLLYLRKILANAKHLLSVINQMLDLSRIESGRLKLTISTVSLPELVRDTIDELHSLVRSDAVSLIADIPDQASPVQADEQKLKQVLINLLGNALKFTEQGMVIIRLITDDQHRPNRIDVTDTGIGIPRNKLDDIFVAFERAGVAGAGDYEGTGLGLAISRSLCRMMGYDLRVHSQPGKGSTFSILLNAKGAARWRYFISNNSTSKINAAFGPISGPAPFAP
jgi:PAS domain S-box-containing protein